MAHTIARLSLQDTVTLSTNSTTSITAARIIKVYFKHMIANDNHKRSNNYKHDYYCNEHL